MKNVQVNNSLNRVYPSHQKMFYDIINIIVEDLSE